MKEELQQSGLGVTGGEIFSSPFHLHVRLRFYRIVNAFAVKKQENKRRKNND
jgi:hypothetical protein